MRIAPFLPPPPPPKKEDIRYQVIFLDQCLLSVCLEYHKTNVETQQLNTSLLHKHHPNVAFTSLHIGGQVVIAYSTLYSWETSSHPGISGVLDIWLAVNFSLAPKQLPV